LWTATALRLLGMRLFRIRIQVKSKLPPKAEREPKCSSSTQGEDHVDRGLHFHRLVVEQVGPVAPGLDGIHGGLLQHGRPADDVQIFDRPVLEISACSTTVP
jgi:hypothetical protein